MAWGMLPFADNVPGAVTTGYQRQNTYLACLETGLDTTEPYDNGEGVITIPAGGLVEYNGVLFKCVEDEVITKPDPNTAYWLAVKGVDNGDGTSTVNIALVTRPGVWYPDKQGCYITDSTGKSYRTLNWVSLGEIPDITEPEMGLFPQNVKGTHTIQLRKGWYYVELASGLGGGDGGDGGNTTLGGTIGDGGSPGIASVRNIIKRPFFHNGEEKLTVKIGGNGQNGKAGVPGTWDSLLMLSQGGSGGGGGGSGEESFIYGIFNTLGVRGGNGGYGGQASGGNSGNNVIGAGGGGGGYGGLGRASNSTLYPVKNGYTAEGGIVGDGTMGSGGSAGEFQQDGSPGGWCKIYQLGQ